jgi:hypothetical protein
MTREDAEDLGIELVQEHFPKAFKKSTAKALVKEFIRQLEEDGALGLDADESEDDGVEDLTTLFGNT